MKGRDDRDELVERWLRRSFATSEHAVTDACLDAETIAAWSDGDLSGRALATAQAHVADCARCQAIVGAMARATTVVAEPERVRRPWFAWAVPLTAAATAVVLWFAVPRESSRPPDLVAESQRRAPDAALAPPANSTRAQGASPAEQPSAARGDVGRRDERQDLDSPRQREQEADRLNSASSAVGGTAKTDSFGAADSSAAAPAAAPASPPPSAPPARESAQRSLEARARAAAPGVVVTSPDPSIRWRLVGRAIQRTSDNGAQWDTVLADASADLIAGAAPSDLVCWVVGAGGVIYLSTDGRRFSRVPFPETTDLAAIQASDGRTASVSTTEGRTFTTTNGGATWTPR